jgi:mRNA interferase MazF
MHSQSRKPNSTHGKANRCGDNRMENGEVRWYAFSPPDKRRPVVILTRNSAIRFLSTVTVAPVTSTVRGIPTEAVLDEGDGLKGICAVNLDHVQTVSKAKIGGFIAKLNQRKMAEIREALLFAMGFDRL